MNLFTEHDLFYNNVIWRGWEKKKNEIKTKIENEIETDCFPMSENTENKPDLPYVREDLVSGICQPAHLPDEDGTRWVWH